VLFFEWKFARSSCGRLGIQRGLLARGALRNLQRVRVAADERELALARGERVRHDGAQDGGQNERGGFEEMAA
jgi:hypothetical protein